MSVTRRPDTAAAGFFTFSYSTIGNAHVCRLTYDCQKSFAAENQDGHVDVNSKKVSIAVFDPYRIKNTQLLFNYQIFVGIPRFELGTSTVSA